MSKKRRWLPIVLGVVILFGFAVIGLFIAGAAWFAQNVDYADASEQEAIARFAEVRQRYVARPPLLTFDGGLRYTEGQLPAVSATAGEISSLRVLVWNPNDRRVAAVTIPFWLIRMNSGPIEFNDYADGVGSGGVTLYAEDIEKYGPGLLLDTTSPSGERILAWTE